MNDFEKGYFRGQSHLRGVVLNMISKKRIESSGNKNKKIRNILEELFQKLSLTPLPVKPQVADGFENETD